MRSSKEIRTELKNLLADDPKNSRVADLVDEFIASREVEAKAALEAEKQQVTPRTVFCPDCQAIAEYDPHFGRYMCTRCSWRSEKALEGQG